MVADQELQGPIAQIPRTSDTNAHRDADSGPGSILAILRSDEDKVLRKWLCCGQVTPS